jgi:hypothetical protein
LFSSYCLCLYFIWHCLLYVLSLLQLGIICPSLCMSVPPFPFLVDFLFTSNWKVKYWDEVETIFFQTSWSERKREKMTRPVKTRFRDCHQDELVIIGCNGKYDNCVATRVQVDKL